MAGGGDGFSVMKRAAQQRTLLQLLGGTCLQGVTENLLKVFSPHDPRGFRIWKACLLPCSATRVW